MSVKAARSRSKWRDTLRHFGSWRIRAEAAIRQGHGISGGNAASKKARRAKLDEFKEYRSRSECCLVAYTCRVYKGREVARSTQIGARRGGLIPAASTQFRLAELIPENHSSMSFADFGLRTELVRAVQARGYERPTPVQEKTIPLILKGQDVLAGAQTGTGKTAAFALPILNLLSDSSPTKEKGPRALVLAPTRELAAQVAEQFCAYGEQLSLRTTVVFGGVNFNPQARELRLGVDIVVATPGRLLDHLNQGTLTLRSVTHFVLDEADRMLDMGFIHDIRRVIERLPKKRQNLLFSATYSAEIRKLASAILYKPAQVDVAPRNTASELVEQRFLNVDKTQKRAALSYVIGHQNWQQVLVFTRTKHGANRLAKQLEADGLTSAAIHGNKSQGARTRALEGFKNGTVRVLVATDIAARGLDIDALPHVVNYELPNVAEDYVHRIGRTGRAGVQGEALSLVGEDERSLLRGIEKLLKRKFELESLEGFEPVPSQKSESQAQPTKDEPRTTPRRRANRRRRKKAA